MHGGHPKISLSSKVLVNPPVSLNLDLCWCDMSTLRGVYNFVGPPRLPPPTSDQRESQPMTQLREPQPMAQPRKLQPQDISLLQSLGIVLSQYLFCFYYAISCLL